MYYFAFLILLMVGQKKYEEFELVQGLKSQQTDAFNYLYDHYHGALYGIIYSIVQEPAVADDVLQESFVKIWRQINTYDASKGRLFTWMLNIARNGSIDKLRSKSFRQQQQNQSLQESVYDSIKVEQPSADLIGLRKMVGELKLEFRQLVELAYFQGYTQEEMSEALQIPLGTVKTRMRAALIELRKKMK
jgi:RNA polymerase sigma factor (sigma-70 family)